MAAKQIKSTAAAAKARAIATGKGPAKKSAKKELTSSSAKLTRLRNQGGKSDYSSDYATVKTRVRDYGAEDRSEQATRSAVKAGVSSRSIKKAIKKGQSNVNTGTANREKTAAKTSAKIAKADSAMGKSQSGASKPMAKTKPVNIRGK
jgi:hypothetical protein